MVYSILFYLGFWTKILYAVLFPPMHAAHHTPLILLDFITVVMFGGENKLRINLC
jgi:hypothetical protein